MLAQAVTGALDMHDDGVVKESVQQRGRDDWIAEHWEMPRRLIGESLRSGSLIRGIPFMASAIPSATGALGGDQHRSSFSCRTGGSGRYRVQPRLLPQHRMIRR